MRYIALLFAASALYASNSKLCKTCHPTIYSEYQNSMHFKSTIKKDPLHAALWSRQKDDFNGEYKCAKCHDPKLDKKLDSGVDCVSCHRIKSIKEHISSNINIYNNNPKLFYSKDKTRANTKIVYHKSSSFFGLFSNVVGSPYHDIDFRNKDFYNGKMCMGCHSHLKNSHNLTLCKNPMQGALDNKQNCITCHMPKVQGSATTIKITKMHAYHGFLGAYNKPEMLAKYIDLSIKKSKDAIIVTIKNNTPHPLFSQPLRVLKLKVEAKQNSKVVFQKSFLFSRTLGKDGVATLPSKAKEIINDTMLKANQSRVLKIDYKANDNTKIVATLGFYKVPPKMIDKLNVDKSLGSFIELKQKILEE
jgi:hypothetical protein